MFHLSSAFQQLSTTDLDPSTFQASRAYHKGKARLTAYIQGKARPSLTLNRDQLQKLLHQSSISPQSKKLTFKSLEQEDVSYLLSKNKRKFGESFKSKGYSAKVSPECSNLPSIHISPKCSPVGTRNERELNKMIKLMIEKKLGILPIGKKLVEKKKTLRKNKKKKSIIGRVKLNEEKSESVYLNPDFSLYNKNIENKLKVERLVVKQHAKERRASMAFGIINKKDDSPLSPYLH